MDAGYWLDHLYQGTYALDPYTTAAGTVRAFPKNLELEARLTFALTGPGAPAAGEEAPSPTGSHLNDLRRLPLVMRYSLSELPEPGYEPRVADERIGYFTEH